MAEDLAHKRPWLLVSLFFGITYPVAMAQDLPGLYLIIWKIAAVGFLIPYALRRHHNGEFLMVAAILAACALGDGLIEFSLEAGGAAFGVAHLIAIWLFSKNRRPNTQFSQKLLAITVFIAAPIIAYTLAGALAAGYTLLLSVMAAMAWTSNFPRYRVGIGAILFVLSDLLIFGREGGKLAEMPAINEAVWYLYYIAMLLIATGVVQTLVKRGYYSAMSASSEAGG